MEIKQSYNNASSKTEKRMAAQSAAILVSVLIYGYTTQIFEEIAKE
jgi:hypothetical protein